MCTLRNIMSSARLTLLLLWAFFLLALHTSEAYTCCRRYSTIKLPFSVIRGLSIQTDIEMCPINAIIFHTKKGKVCFNPASNWVMDYINRIRNKAMMVHTKTTHP